VRTSRVPSAATSGSFRRLTRPGATLTKRLGLPPGAAAAIVAGINEGRLRPAPPKVAPPAAIGLGDAANAIQPANEPAWIERLLEAHPWLRFLPLVLLLLVLVVAFLVGGAGAALVALAVAGPVAAGLFAVLSRWSRRARAQGSIREERQTPASVAGLPVVGNFTITRPGTSFTPQPSATDSAEAARFKVGLRDAFAFTAISFPAPVKPTLDLASLTGKVVRGIDPAVALPNRLKQIVYLPPWLVEEMVEQFTACMAYPVFDIPMYKPLSELSSELFLPNINLVPHNSLTLLESNPRFIESYFVGLNHEMARELLWNEYPTDQRGSYFRQFWDVSTILPPRPTPADREKLRDIDELHLWSRYSGLGTHDPRAQAGEGARLVLVIRGDLLKRYPTAVIYAQKAKWPADPTQERELVELSPGEEDDPPKSKVRLPLFEAKVDPDIYFIGFDLHALEAKGGSGPDQDPGWFFVIKERPGEPRFGMDDVPGSAKPRLINWNDLAWVDVGTPPGGLVRLDETLTFDVYDPPVDQEDKPDPADAQARWSSATNSAELAYILYRVPVLVAVHASRMLS